MSFIHWNCRGYRSRYADITCILRSCNPSCLCLQESMLGLFTPQRPRGYSLYTHSAGLDAVPGDGLVTLVHDSVPHIPLQPNTALQALAHS